MRFPDGVAMRDECGNAPLGSITAPLANRLSFTPSEAGSLSFLSPPELRAALRGHWLYLAGDSSVRGFYLSLFQQLLAARDGVFHVERYLGIGQEIKSEPIRFLRWHDAIIDATNGTLLAVDGSTGWTGCIAWGVGSRVARMSLGLWGWLPVDPVGWQSFWQMQWQRLWPVCLVPE